MTLFDDGFRRLLRELVQRVRRSRSRPEEGDRARRRRLSSSGTFTGHRAYAQGEDLRSLDWNVYARTGELFVKVLEEEQRRSLSILVDASPSMSAGAPPRFDGARRIAALLGGVALARLDGLNLVTADGVASLTGAASIEALLEQLDELPYTGVDASTAVVRWAERGLRGRVAWISDFASHDETVHGLHVLGRARREAIGILPRITDDELPPIDGYVALRDPESEEVVRVRIDARLRAGIEVELRTLARRQEAAFREAGVPLLRQRIPAADDWRAGVWTDGGWTAWI